MKQRTPGQLWTYMTEMITELRGFESRFQTKIIRLHHYWSNDHNLEMASESFIPKLLKADIGLYMDDTPTQLYPYPIKDQMFFLECSKEIPNYQDFIMMSLIQSKRGHDQTMGKLGNQKFLEKAPEEIILMEKQKLEDFGFRWELWTKSFLIYGD